MGGGPSSKPFTDNYSLTPHCKFMRQALLSSTSYREGSRALEKLGSPSKVIQHRIKSRLELKPPDRRVHAL